MDTSPHQRRKTERDLRKTDCPVLPEDKAETAHGYHPCMTCGNLIPQSQTVCIRCENKLEKTEEGSFILILKENPHYKYEDCLAVFGKTGQKNKNHPRPSSFFL
ncbi:MAG: hypothetical protein ACLR1D_04955 [Dialister sp.]